MILNGQLPARFFGRVLLLWCLCFCCGSLAGCATSPGTAAGGVLVSTGLSRAEVVSTITKYFDEHGNEIGLDVAKKLHAEGKIVSAKDIQELRYTAGENAKSIAEGVPYGTMILQGALTVAGMLGLLKGSQVIKKKFVNPSV